MTAVIVAAALVIAALFCLIAIPLMDRPEGRHVIGLNPLPEKDQPDEDAETLIWLAGLHDNPEPSNDEAPCDACVAGTCTQPHPPPAEPDPYDPDTPWPGHDTGWFAAIPVSGLADGQDDPEMVRALNALGSRLASQYGAR